MASLHRFQQTFQCLVHCSIKSTQIGLFSRQIHVAVCSTNHLTYPKFIISNVSNSSINRLVSVNENSLALSAQQCRTYAKKVKKTKDKDKGKKGAKAKMTLSEEELNSVIDFHKVKHQMELSIENLKKEYIEQLSIRTSAGVFDNLMVETSDGKFSLIQLGQVAQKNPQLIAINLAACPQYINDVKMAIANSGMNLNPQQDGTSLFVPIPKVTREHREGLAKNAKLLCDKTKEKLRDIQNRSVKELKKSKEGHSEDLIRSLQDTIHNTMHDYSGMAEKLMASKQQELLGK